MSKNSRWPHFFGPSCKLNQKKYKFTTTTVTEGKGTPTVLRTVRVDANLQFPMQTAHR